MAEATSGDSSLSKTFKFTPAKLKMYSSKMVSVIATPSSSNTGLPELSSRSLKNL